MENKATSRHRRWQLARIAAGLCANCGKRPLGAYAERCDDCALRHRNANRESQRRRQLARIAAGLCANCGKRSLGAYAERCDDCMLRHRNANRESQRQRTGHKPGRPPKDSLQPTRTARMKENITVEGQHLEIDTRPLTLLYKSPGTGDIISGRVVITPELTVRWADRDEAHPRTEALFLRLFPTQPPRHSLATRHAWGLIDMTLHCLDRNVPVHWQHPETYLRPALQAELGDILILLAGRIVIPLHPKHE